MQIFIKPVWVEVVFLPGIFVTAPISLRIFSTKSRKVETLLLSLRNSLDKSRSISDCNLYRQRDEWERRPWETRNRVRLRQTFRLPQCKRSMRHLSIMWQFERGRALFSCLVSRNLMIFFAVRLKCSEFSSTFNKSSSVWFVWSEWFWLLSPVSSWQRLLSCFTMGNF